MADPARIEAHPPDAAGDPGSFHTDLAAFQHRYAALWWQSATDLPPLGEPRDRRRQRTTESAIDRFVDELHEDFSAYPRNASQRAFWRPRTRQKIRRFAEDALEIPPAHGDVIFSDAYFEVTAEFTRRARAFDEGMTIDDVSQALRNLWIMNLFQSLFGRGVRCTDAVFAYSMLYPFTDNYLDDTRRSPAEKADFNRRLARRLAGQRLATVHPHEADVYRLVEMIEAQYARRDHSEIYASLLAIHRAQTESLEQHGRRSPYEVDVLGLSVAKGGASVLADGYLVAGRLNRADADFCFGYGVVLQLFDDLQDVAGDLAARHMTIFSQTARRWPLDGITCQLVHFLDGVLESYERFRDPRRRVLKDLIRQSCVKLMIGAVAWNRKYYTSRFLRALERHSLTRFAYVRKKRPKIRRRYRDANRRLAEVDVDSIFGALA